MALLFGFDEDSTHSAIIYVLGSKAHEQVDGREGCIASTPGLIVGSSEWGWVDKNWGHRICSALSYFSEVDTNVLRIIGEVNKHKV